MSVNGTLSTCSIAIPTATANANNTFSFSNIYSVINSSAVITNTLIKIKSWSYFVAMAQFYAVC